MCTNPNIGFLTSSIFASVWWKDLLSVSLSGSVAGDWVVASVLKKLGDGSSIRFWKDTWFGDCSLEQLFPRLFSLLD